MASTVKRSIRPGPAILLTLLLGLAAGSGERAAAAPLVVELTIQGDINPATVAYLDRGLREAQARRAALLLIKLDTPGGQLISTSDITSRLLAAEVPVGLYVAPQGARAASAGTFIVYAAHVAGMAPSTTIGAAHPVFLGGMPGIDGGEAEGLGEQMKTMEEKVVNDAVAQIRGLAQRRGRNVEWAERAVRESVTATAEEAVQLGVVDFVAATAEDYLAQAHGREVELPTGPHTLQTAGGQLAPVQMNWRESLLARLAHPNIAYLLLIIGFYGIIFELRSPSFGGAGVVGIISLLLGLYGLAVLPFNWVGLTLLLVGLGFLIAEVYTPTYGALGAGGLAAFAIGSLMLIDAPAMGVSRPLIAGVTVGTGLFFLFLIAAVVQGQRRRVTIGHGALVGREGTVRSRLDPQGMVHVDGALWSAQTEQAPLEVGERVVVLEELPHLRLRVGRATGPPAAEA